MMILHLQFILFYRNWKMAKKNQMAQTSSSFYNSTGFSYRNNEKAIDFSLLKSSQKDGLLSLLRHQTHIDEDKLAAHLDKIQQQSRKFIESLLEEVASNCAKIRQLQDQIKNIGREKNTEIKRLREENMVLFTSFESQKRQRQIEKTTLTEDLKYFKKISANYKRQNEGLKKLNTQYQTQFFTLNNQLQKFKQKALEQQQNNKILTQKLIIEQEYLKRVQEDSSKLCLQRQTLGQVVSSLQFQQAQIPFFAEALQQIIEKNKQLELECNQLRKKVFQNEEIRKHLEYKLLEANGEIVRHQTSEIRLSKSKNEVEQDILKKDSQWRKIIKQLHIKSTESIEKIKSNYDKKLKKLMTILKKQISTLKTYYKSLKEDMTKQMLLCIKLMKREAKQEAQKFVQAFPSH